MTDAEMETIVQAFLDRTYGVCDPQEWKRELIAHLIPYFSDRDKLIDSLRAERRTPTPGTIEVCVRCRQDIPPPGKCQLFLPSNKADCPLRRPQEAK